MFSRSMEVATLEDAANGIALLRNDLLFDEEFTAGLSPRTEQNFLIALSHLEAASRHLKLAQLEQHDGR